jgi:hypothetical protein
MTLIGLDLNATRARAVAAAAGEAPQPADLDSPCADLALTLSLEGDRIEVGAGGLRLARRSPHLAQLAFLPELGQPRPASARRLLDGTSATALALTRLEERCHPCQGAVFAVPPYLSTPQVGLLFGLSEEAGLPLLGAVSAPLASALAARATRDWAGTAVLLDADDHALSVSALAPVDGELQLLETRVLARLGLRAWTERLLNALADRCILQSRRDPRDCPAAEQGLFEQLGEVMAACREGRQVGVEFQAARWYQSLVLAPEDTVAFCAGLARQALAEVADVCTAPWPTGAPGLVLVTADAARMPGLVAGLEASVADWRAAAVAAHAAPPAPCGDFGEGLLDAEDEDAAVEVLASDAAARAAHALAVLFARGDLPPGYLDVAVPLHEVHPADPGAPRLHYQGHDYPLDRPNFVLGWRPTCDLVFACDAYPTVSPRHCEILRTDDGFALCDRSRTGTFVNEQPVRGAVRLRSGDALRLGPRGPVLRFLGGMVAALPVGGTA